MKLINPTYDMRPRHFLYILLLLPLFIVRDYQPSHELKYFSIVDEALENNTWFAFYNHGEEYADKPPLFFWFMMVSKMLTGKHLLWLVGLLVLFSAAGIMAIMDKWLTMARVRHNPLASSMMLGTCLMFLGGAAVLRMDMLMVFFIVLSLYTFFKLYTGQGKGPDRWLLGLWIFLAVFSKGPVGLFVPVFSIIVFLAVKKESRSAGKYLGWRPWSVILGLSAIWFGMVYLEGGKEYLENLLFNQTVGRGVDAYHHKEPVWFYLVNVFWMIAPWTLLFIAAFWTGLKNNLMDNDTQTLFYCVIVTTFLMLSAFSSKVQIYLLPAFPFAAYLVSAYMYRSGGNRWVRIGAGIPAAVMILAFPVSFFAGRFVKFGYESLMPFHIALFILTIGACYSLWFIMKKKVSRGVAGLSVSMLLTFAAASFGIGQFNEYFGFGTMARGGMESAREAGTDNYAYFQFYRGQNMDVYTGHKMHTIETVGQVDSLIRGEKPTVMFMLAKELDRVEGMRDVLEGQRIAGTAYKYQWYVLGGTVNVTSVR